MLGTGHGQEYVGRPTDGGNSHEETRGAYFPLQEIHGQHQLDGVGHKFVYILDTREDAFNVGSH